MPFVYMDELSGVGALGKKKKKGLFGSLKKIVGKVLKVTPIGMAATFAKKQFLGKKKKKGGAAVEEESEAPLTPTTDAEQAVPVSYEQPEPSAPVYAPPPAYPEQAPQQTEVVQAPPVDTQITEPEPEEKMQPTTDIVPEMYPERFSGGGEDEEPEMEGMIVKKPTPPYAIGRTPPKSAAWLKQAKTFRSGGRRVGAPFTIASPRYSITKAPKIVGGRMTSPFLGPQVEPAGMGANLLTDRWSPEQISAQDRLLSLAKQISAIPDAQYAVAAGASDKDAWLGNISALYAKIMGAPSAMVPDTGTISEWEARLGQIRAALPTETLDLLEKARSRAAGIAAKAIIMPENMIAMVLKEMGSGGTAGLGLLAVAAVATAAVFLVGRSRK